MNMKYRIVITLAIALLLSSPAVAAQTLTVDGDGGQDFLTIQDAVDTAAEGDTIVVYPGTYNETIELIWKNLTIVSQSGNPEDTIITSSGRIGTGVYVDQFSHLILSGFTVTDYEYGVYSEGTDSAIGLNNNIFADNKHGAHLFEKMLVDVYDNKFIDNQRGLHLDRSTIYSPGKDIRNNLFSGNDVGYHNDDSSVVVFSGNTMVNNTRAVHVLYSGGAVKDNMIYDNEWGITGGPTSLMVYNNYLSNDVNIDIMPTGFDNHFNVPPTAGLNIVGGPSIGGNYWANPEGTGFSQVTPDMNRDGFCDEEYIVYGAGYDLVDYYPLADWNGTQPTQEIPEFPTIALPMIAIIGLALFFKRRE